jgi:hypothetical protein
MCLSFFKSKTPIEPKISNIYDSVKIRQPSDTFSTINWNDTPAGVVNIKDVDTRGVVPVKKKKCGLWNTN